MNLMATAKEIHLLPFQTQKSRPFGATHGTFWGIFSALLRHPASA